MILMGLYIYIGFSKKKTYYLINLCILNHLNSGPNKLLIYCFLIYRNLTILKAGYTQLLACPHQHIKSSNQNVPPQLKINRNC